MSDHSNLFACIMAGGSGERFWPMSRAQKPKHLLKLLSERTLVEETVRRLAGAVPPGNIFVLTNAVQLAGTRAALAGILPEAQIVAEPEFRKRLNELGGVSMTSGNTTEAFAEVIQRELAVLPKTAMDLGLKLD